MWSEPFPSSITLLYSIILNPEKIYPSSKKSCGVPLRIPIQEQVLRIQHCLPGVKRIGLLFDPLWNQTFFSQAKRSAEKLGLHVVPLRIPSPKEIPGTLSGAWNQIDSLWMIPDRTIISESIIKYVIKESLIHRIPVIGYNQFFYESGAAMNFIFDYQRLGNQTGRLALTVIGTHDCPKPNPEYEILLNHQILSKIGVAYTQPVDLNEGEK